MMHLPTSAIRPVLFIESFTEVKNSKQTIYLFAFPFQSIYYFAHLNGVNLNSECEVYVRPSKSGGRATYYAGRICLGGYGNVDFGKETV